jgi:heme-degrading monooxygenase HmoA
VSVTVVAVRRGQPGRADTLVRAAIRRWREAEQQPAGPRALRLFRSVEPPDTLLYASEWETPAAFWAYLSTYPPQDLDAHSLGGPTRSFFRRLLVMEHMGRTAQVVACTLTHAPPGSRELWSAHNDAARAELRDQPGFVFRYVYEDLADPHRLLSLYGWQSQTAMERYRATARREPWARLRERGARTQRFAELTRMARDCSSE